MYSSTLSLTALDRGGWTTPRPSSCTSHKETRYSLRKKLGGHWGRSGGSRNIWTPSGLEPRIAKPLASRAMGKVTVQLYSVITSNYTRWVVSFTPQPLYPKEKQLQYTLNGKQDWHHSLSSLFGEDKCFLSLPRIELRFLQRPGCSLSTITTTPSPFNSNNKQYSKI